MLIKHWAAAPGLRGRGVLRLVSSGVMEEGREERSETEGKNKEGV